MCLKHFCVVLAIFSAACCETLAAIDNGEARQTVNNRRCIAPDNSYGYCTHAARCPLPEFKQDRLKFMDYFCIIDRLYIGVCCPDRVLFQSQLGTTVVGNPAAVGQFPTPFDANKGQQGIELQPVVTDSSGGNVPRPPVSSATPPERRGCGLNEKMEASRVTGGRVADPKEWPWMVALMRDLELQFCGGCLITERHVLTAAHCVHSFVNKPHEIWARLGEHDFTRYEETRPQNINVSRIRSHPEFDDVTYENDIAILVLERAVTFNSYVWPACLPDLSDLFTGKPAVVIGWGTIEYGGPVSDKLMEVSVPVWANSDCEKHYVQSIHDTNLCAGGEDGKDSCKGDSGGPLLLQMENRRWVAIGIVSWGIKCGEERPAVYTRVNRYLDWIVRNTI